MNYKKKTILLIVIATLVRCIVACCTQLGNDEVYYRMYAQYLHWNYFDHPPMVGWLIRLTTINLFLDNELFIRLGAIIAAAITTWLLYCCGKKLNNAYTGFLAAIIYTATICGSIIAGTFILPDAPQMIFWTAGLYLLISVVTNDDITTINKRNVFLFGVVMGLGMLCKIHTAFLWIGFLLYIIFYNRKWLLQPVLYFAGIITVLFFYPVIQWNIDNHFVTYLYHSSRVNVASGGFNINSFLTFAIGQAGYLNPIIFFFIIVAISAAVKNKLPILTAQKRLLLCCSLPLIITASVISLFKDVLPHWTGPAYSGLILLTACYFSTQNRKVPRSLKFACALITVAIAGGIYLINFLPGTLGKKDNPNFGEGDFTLDMYGWHDIEHQLKHSFEVDTKAGLMKGNAPIICNKWFPAAHLDVYVGMPLKKDVIAIGDTNDIHQYAWINTERKILQPGDDAYCIVPSNYPIDAKVFYAPYFCDIQGPQILEQKRNGAICRFIYIYRCKNYINKKALW